LGQLGLNNLVQLVSFPTFVTSSIQISQISAGENHGIILSNSGTAYSFGHNGFGQLGLNNLINSLIPTPIFSNVISNAFATKVYTLLTTNLFTCND
jgi:alpha-tubulin suppressor-like RCC1 family protein